MRTGNVPRSWRATRKLVRVSLHPGAEFLYVERAATRAFLEQELRIPLTAFGVEELDVPIIRGKDRRITRMISQWAYTYQREDGVFPYAGIRYESRVDSEFECWALFEDTDYVVRSAESIPKENISLREVANLFSLSSH